MHSCRKGAHLGDMSAVALVSNPIRRRRRYLRVLKQENFQEGRADLIWQHVARILEVVITKCDGHIESRKYRGEEQVCPASGPDFQKATLHMAIFGLEEKRTACDPGT